MCISARAVAFSLRVGESEGDRVECERPFLHFHRFTVSRENASSVKALKVQIGLAEPGAHDIGISAVYRDVSARRASTPVLLAMVAEVAA